MVYTCTVCGETKTESLGVLEHSITSEWTVDIAPTCETDGSKSHHCTVCDAKTDITIIPHTGHKYDAGIVTVPPTCTTEGEKVYTCAACGNTKTEILPVLNDGEHQFSNNICTACGMLEFAYTIENGYVTVIGYNGNATEITVPETLGGYEVAAIGDAAFSACTPLTDIVLPSSINNICENAILSAVTLHALSGSYAETFAQNNGYTFIALDLVKNDETDISVSFPPENLPAENTVLNVEKLSAEENTITYDITLTVNDEIVQPASAVTVKIPVPETMDGAQCKVYRQEADGTYTDMQATYQDGYMVFTTDHFSTYVLTTADPNAPTYTLGDVNGDDKINAVDARWVLQVASGVRTFDATQTAAADVNGDGKVNAVDARWILQVASDARTL